MSLWDDGVSTGQYRRAVAALEIEEPDTVPVFEMHTSVQISRSILGREPHFGNSPLVLDLAAAKRDDRVDEWVVRDLLDLQRSLRLDFMKVPGGHSPGTRVEKIGGNEWVVDGRRYSWHTGTLWRVDWPSLYDPEALSRRLRELEDRGLLGAFEGTARRTVLEKLSAEAEVEERASERLFTVLSAVARELKGRVFLTFDADGSWGPIVSNPPLLINVLGWMRTRPDLVRTLIDFYTRDAIRVGEAALDEGADGILMCVDYGYSDGPWMSPAQFRETVKPALRRQCNAFRRKGGFALLHSDGNIQPLLKDIVDAGVEAYQGIDYQAGMDLRRVKEEVGDRVCLIGNVSPAALEGGSEMEVAKEVLRCIGAAAPGGGYVLSASANVSVNSNTRNFLAMIRAARRYGGYRPS